MTIYLKHKLIPWTNRILMQGTKSMVLRSKFLYCKTVSFAAYFNHNIHGIQPNIEFQHLKSSKTNWVFGTDSSCRSDKEKLQQKFFQKKIVFCGPVRTKPVEKTNLKNLLSYKFTYVHFQLIILSDFQTFFQFVEKLENFPKILENI